MESSIGPLLPLFVRERSAGRAVALGVVLRTAGSTYRKPGALMLIARNGEYAGLLSGGCLESDLREHALSVIDTGTARVISYDLRGPDEALWGLGVGCEGAMDILLLRVGPTNDWQPLALFAECLDQHTPTAVGLFVGDHDTAHPGGSVLLPAQTSEPEQQALRQRAANAQPGWFNDAQSLFVLPLSLPPRILMLGAGPDAAPVVDFGARLGWKFTVVDHRPAYAHSTHFPAADKVVLTRPDELHGVLDLNRYQAAVVMSHHLPSDLGYLEALANTSIPYIGLLGPPARREKLLADVGEKKELLRSRLRAPVGLALGGRAPESIALAIVAELHAFVHGMQGGPFGAERSI